MGIASSKSLWATDLNYLNDAREFSYAMDVARNVVGGWSTDGLSSDQSRLLERLQFWANTDPDQTVFVVSFTEHGDQLSQWRSYCPRNGGYSLGFHTLGLRCLARSNGFRFLKCIYDPERQEGVVRALVDYVLTVADEKPWGPDYAPDASFDDLADGLALQFVVGLVEAAPVMKHPSFQEESEWRLVLRGGLDREKLGFRAGMSFLVPFIKFPLDAHYDSMLLSRLFVGPTPHPDLALSSARSFLWSKGFSGFEATESSVPYRGW